MIPNGPYMDMHTHILPGLDDGSQSMEQTVNMLKTAYDEGIRVIVATPHFGIRNPGFRLDEARKVLEEARRKADEITPGLKLLLGNELYYSAGIAESLERGEASTIGGTSYALVEFSTGDSREKIYQCVNELTWKGYRPIIAHLERYRCLEGDVETVRDLVSRGAAVQINCRTFMDGAVKNNAGKEPARKKGLFGILGRSDKNANRTDFFLERKGDWARTLLSEGLVHFIASDCHDDRHRSPVYRTALESMEGYCEEQILRDISRNNAIRLIRNANIVKR